MEPKTAFGRTRRIIEPKENRIHRPGQDKQQMFAYLYGAGAERIQKLLNDDRQVLTQGDFFICGDEVRIVTESSHMWATTYSLNNASCVRHLCWGRPVQVEFKSKSSQDTTFGKLKVGECFGWAAWQMKISETEGVWLIGGQMAGQLDTYQSSEFVVKRELEAHVTR